MVDLATTIFFLNSGLCKMSNNEENHKSQTAGHSGRLTFLQSVHL